MFIPSGFKPSFASRIPQFDDEGRLHEFNLSRQSTGGTGDANSLYATEAERFGTIAPFLKANMMRDRGRRSYFIQQGGACIYEGSPQERKMTFPDEKESFGHNSMDGSKLSDHQGRTFQLGNSDHGLNRG